MPIRMARRGDLDAVSDILTRAFWDDDMIGRLMHPRRNEYPGDVTWFWRRIIRLGFWDWTVMLVVATDPQDGKVVGVAEWEGKGIIAARTRLRWWDPRNLPGILLQWQYRLSRLVWPNRAADPVYGNAWEDAYPHIAHFWSGRRADGYYLESLAVTPDQRGRGYGKDLVQWGIQRAEADGVCASVVVGEGTIPFYMKCGFDVIAGSSCEGEGNPLNGVKGGEILFKDAPADG